LTPKLQLLDISILRLEKINIINKYLRLPFLSVLIKTISLSEPVFLAWLPSDSREKKCLVVSITATFSFTASVIADKYPSTDSQSSLPESVKGKSKIKSRQMYISNS
jgi:hypothetical protein